MTMTIVIIGGGQAGISAAQTLRQKKFTGSIILIAAEAMPPYERPPLSKAYLKGEIGADRLPFKKPTWYRDRDIQLRLDTHAVAIDREAHRVELNDGSAIDYDKLILATGGDARGPDLAGTDLDGVLTLRTYLDAECLRDRLLSAGGGQHRLVVLGGGYIGLEAAASALALTPDIDLRVTVIEAEARLLSRSLSEPVAAMIHDRHCAAGVDFRFGTTAASVVGEDQVMGVRIGRAEMIAANTLLIGVGMAPATALAQAAGIECDGGIIVDSACRTNDADIFAAGDCTRGPVLGTASLMRLESVQNAVDQGRQAALAILGEPPPEHLPVPWFWSDQYDLSLQIAGIADPDDQAVERRGEHDLAICYLREGRLAAIETLNRPKDFAQAKTLIARGAMLDPARLADPALTLKDCCEPAS